MTIITLQLTPDEADLLQQMRAWTDGVPDDALGHGQENAIYVHLVAARAELYRMALRHGDNDLFDRYEHFHRLLSPGLVLTLCRAWHAMTNRLR